MSAPVEIWPLDSGELCERRREVPEQLRKSPAWAWQTARCAAPAAWTLVTTTPARRTETRLCSDDLLTHGVPCALRDVSAEL